MTILLATALTLGYGFAAQAAMSASRVETMRRLGTWTPTAEEATTRVWYGGMLPPVTVEVSASGTDVPRCPVT